MRLALSLTVITLATAWQTPFLYEKSAAEILQNVIDYSHESVDIDHVLSVWNQVFDFAPEVKKTMQSFGKSAKQAARKIEYPKKSLEDEFVFVSESHKGYSLRGQSPDPSVLQIDNVKQYSGYIDVEEEDKHFFYWFFESRNDPANDPVILWLNGGPGCSSFLGLLFELGPKLMTVNGSLEFNPYSWNSNASIIFLDQPVGVGYSYSGSSQVSNSFAAAKDVFVFLDLFFLKFPQYSHLPFHISGESYAGVYIPLIASEIMSQPQKSFNLTSILIGNGITDPQVQYKYYQPMLCGQGGHPQLISDEKCDQMLVDQTRCGRLLDACYLSSYSKFACLPALIYCEAKVSSVLEEYHINAYDVRMTCDGDDCYPEQEYITKYLNDDKVKAALGAEVDSFEQCSNEVFERFLLSADQIYPYQTKIAELMDQWHLPVLIYAGDKDYICNWLGNEAWTDELDFAYHDEFMYIAEKQKYITGSGAYAGDFKTFANFTFLRLFDSGHMVPHDQGANSLSMVVDWITGGLV